MATIQKTIHVCDKCKKQSEEKFRNKYPTYLKADVDLQTCQGDKIMWVDLCPECNDKVQAIIRDLIEDNKNDR